MVRDVDVKEEEGVASHQVKTGSIAASSNQERVECLFQVAGRGGALSKCTTEGSQKKGNKVHLGCWSRKR
jgi:hypothetical protein